MIYFAGAETGRYAYDLIENGVTRVLFSYYWIQDQRREGHIRILQERHPNVSYFLDSGAFTYFSKFEKEPEKLLPWKEYKERYFDYIDNTWYRWNRIAELDLDQTFNEITVDLVDEWREEMFRRWPDAPIVPVWHAHRGHEAWTRYCEDPRVKYLAIGSGHSQLGQIRRLIWEAHRKGKHVHGFAMTRVQTDLPYLPYDSVDSSSWLTGQRYGSLFVFQGTRFIVLLTRKQEDKHYRSRYRSHFKRIGLDWQLIENDHQAECRKANIIAWKRLSDRLEEIRRRRGQTLSGLPEGSVIGKNPAEHSILGPLAETVEALPRDSYILGVPKPREDEVASRGLQRDGTDTWRPPKNREFFGGDVYRGIERAGPGAGRRALPRETKS